MSFIELSNISLTFKTRFQKIPVFSDMNFSADKGEFVLDYQIELYNYR